jgi:hypothetical protein
MNNKKITQKLNQLKDIAFEQWPKHGIKLKAVSANANGLVNSGITKCGVYFFRKWEGNNSELITQ